MQKSFSKNFYVVIDIIIYYHFPLISIQQKMTYPRSTCLQFNRVIRRNTVEVYVSKILLVKKNFNKIIYEYDKIILMALNFEKIANQN